MPRPFPFPLNVGTDICSVKRIFNILKTQKDGNAFLRRILLDQEREQFQQKGYSKLVQSEDKLRKKIHQLIKRRIELGIPKPWREQVDQVIKDNKPGNPVSSTSNAPKLAQDATFDTTTNEQPSSNPSPRWVNHFDILRHLEDEILTEHKAMSKQLKGISQFIAGRYAAKEAAMKAHRQRRLTWHDIWIRGREAQNGMTQAPEALIISEDGSWEDAQIVPMSISHDQAYATAVCMAFEAPTGPSTPATKPAIPQAEKGRDNK